MAVDTGTAAPAAANPPGVTTADNGSNR
jgi:hypothetical protein